MKILLICLISGILVFAVSPANAQGWEWVKKSGGTLTDEAEIVSVDKAGNILITGKYTGSFQIGTFNLSSQGGKDIFVAKYDPLGTVLWARTAGGANNDEGLCVGVDDSNNVLVTGFYRGTASFEGTVITGGSSNDIFIAKYNANGVLKWVRNAYGPAEDHGKGIDADRHGNVLVTGYYEDSCDFGPTLLVSPGIDNVFLAKYDPNGNLLWVSEGGGPYETWASSVSTDQYDNAYLTGSFRDTAVFGSKTLISYGGNDVFLVRADSAGNWTMAVHGGGIDNDYGNGIEVDALNQVAVTGSFFQTVNFPPAAALTSHGDKDGFAAYYDTQGACLWARNMGGGGSDKGIGISTDSDANVYVTGYVSGIPHFDGITDTAAGGDDIFIAKYSKTGAIQYAQLAGGTSQDYGKGIDVTQAGVVYITGFFLTTAHFGNTTLVSTGDRDAYLARYYDGSPVIVIQPQDITVCAGDSVTLNVAASGPGPFNYLWFDDAGSILGAVNNQYSFLAGDTTYTGLYYCNVGNAFGSVTSYKAIVSVKPLPVVEIGNTAYMWIHDSLLIDAGSGFSSYQWSTLQTSQSIMVYGASLGLGQHPIAVTVTNIWGCEASDTLLISVMVNAIPETANAGGIILTPNPAEAFVHIRSDLVRLQSVTLFDINGKPVLFAEAGSNSRELDIDISTLRAAVYLVRIDFKDGTACFRKLLVH